MLPGIAPNPHYVFVIVINPFLANVAILYPLKDFLMFSGGMEWKNWPDGG